MKPAQVAVLDQIVRVLVMAREADVAANVVHQRGIFEPFTLAIREAMDGPRLIEQGEPEAHHLIGVFSVVAAALGELQRAATSYVRNAVNMSNLSSVTADVVEDEPFTQGEITQRQFLGAKAAKDRVEQDRTGHDQVRASRIQAGYRQPLLEIEFRHLLANPVDLLRGDMQVAQLGGRSTARSGRCHRTNAENGPG